MARSRPAAVVEEIRSRLIPASEAGGLETQGATKAGVLVPLFFAGDQLHAVFTKRREDLRRHPGEISFPGGRQEEGEPDLLSTALREADEEIGLSPESVAVIGALPPTSTIVTNYAVYPFVAMIEGSRQWRPSPREVAQVLELSLPALRSGYAKRRLVRRGIPIRTETYLLGGHLIWGATARILSDLLQRLRGIA